MSLFVLVDGCQHVAVGGERMATGIGDTRSGLHLAGPIGFAERSSTTAGACVASFQRLDGFQLRKMSITTN